MSQHLDYTPVIAQPRLGNQRPRPAPTPEKGGAMRGLVICCALLIVTSMLVYGSVRHSMSAAPIQVEGEPSLVPEAGFDAVFGAGEVVPQEPVETLVAPDQGFVK